MAVQSFLAKEGLRFGILGSAASLALAYPLANGDYSPAAHTDATRMGTYADRTPSSEAVVTNVMGVDTLRVGVLGLQLQVGIGIFPASTAGASGYASIRLPHGVAPDTNIANGDLWTTTAGLFARINGATVGPFSSGGVTGSGSATVIAIWSGATTLTQNTAFTISGTALLATASAANSTVQMTATNSAATGAATTADVNTANSAGYKAIIRSYGAANTATIASIAAGNAVALGSIGGATSIFYGTLDGVGLATVYFVSGTVDALHFTSTAISLNLPTTMAAEAILIGCTPAAGATGVATFRLPHGAAPTDNITNGDLWTTTAGLFARINGATVGPFSAGGGGTIGGTIAANQVAFGTGVDTIGGDAGFKYDSGTNVVEAGGYAFTGTVTTGIFSSFADDIDVLCAGASILDITAGRVITNVQIQSSTTGFAAPAYSFSSATDMGMLKDGGDLCFGTGGVERLRIASTNVTGSARMTAGSEFEGGNGTSVKPTFSFTSDDNTGMYRVGADNLGFSTANVLRIDLSTTTMTFADAFDIAFNGTTGTKMGTAITQKLSFWNATPIVQPAAAAQAALAAYATGAFGLDSDANMQAMYDLVMAMRTVLVNTGLMKGAA